jgi:hypothetical protein
MIEQQPAARRWLAVSRSFNVKQQAFSTPFVFSQIPLHFSASLRLCVHPQFIKTAQISACLPKISW